MMQHLLERYRYRLLSASLLLAVALFFFWIWVPVTSSAVGFLTNAASDVAANKRASAMTIPPDSLVVRYRTLSARISDLGNSRAKPSDILQKILAVSSGSKVVLQDMTTRDPVTTRNWIEYPVNLRATGQSNAILSFLASLENGSLCITIASITMVPASSGVEATVSLSVFVPPEDDKP